MSDNGGHGEKHKAGSGLGRGEIRKGLLIRQPWRRGKKEVREELGQSSRAECLSPRAKVLRRNGA